MVDNEEQGSQGNAKEAKKKSPIMLIVILLVVLGLIGGGVAFFLLGKKDDANANKEKTQAAQESGKYEVFEFDTFVVNLAKASNFLRTTILIEYDPSLLSGSQDGDEPAEGGEGHEGGTEVNAKSLTKIFQKRDAMIRDAIISTLSYKTPDELLTQDGKDALKEELVDAINNALGLDESIVVSVYFKEFIMQ